MPKEFLQEDVQYLLLIYNLMVYTMLGNIINNFNNKNNDCKASSGL